MRKLRVMRRTKNGEWVEINHRKLPERVESIVPWELVNKRDRQERNDTPVYATDGYYVRVGTEFAEIDSDVV